MSKRYTNLEEAMCKELEKLDKKYGGDTAEMTVDDAEKADLIYHALKSAATYHAMKDAEEWEEDGMSARSGKGYPRNDRSYARARDSMGRYVSRDMEGYSGHYPMYPHYPMSYDGPDMRY